MDTIFKFYTFKLLIHIDVVTVIPCTVYRGMKFQLHLITDNPRALLSDTSKIRTMPTTTAFAPSPISITPSERFNNDCHIGYRRSRMREKTSLSVIPPLQSFDSVDLSSQPELSPANKVRRLLIRDAKPVTIGRRGVTQDFAVTMMRTGYSVTDDLDIIAMQEFQKRFFETRQSEWEVYLKKNKLVKQGVLADPSYFDFISFAQMLTIHNAISKPFAIFEEKFQEASGDFKTRIVKRDTTSLPDSSAIYIAWQRMMGKRLFDAFSPSFGSDLTSQILQSNVPVTTLQQVIYAIYDFFERNGFCIAAQWKSEDLLDKRKKGILGHTEMVAPCILWGNHTLKKRRCIPNDYDAFVVKAAIQSHFNMAVEFDSRFTETSIVRTWRVCQNDVVRLQA